MLDTPGFSRRTNSAGRTVLAVAAAALVWLTAPQAGATTLPAGFSEMTVTSGLSAPNSFAFAPDGRIFVCQQNGQLRVVDASGNLLPTPFVSLTVSSVGERGLLGVALDPAFATNGFVYVYYTATTPNVHNRISRFTANGNVAVPGSELVLLDCDPLSGATNHNAGALRFGADGKLYIATGDNANGANAQNRNNLLGKILRLNKDGSIPPDNPFFNDPTPGLRKEIWAFGFRNPWRFTFQPGTQAMFIADVGQNSWEEVSIGVPGGNFGWPTMEGLHCYPPSQTSCNMTGLTLPIHEYAHSAFGAAGSSITGGDFYEGTAFPTEYVGSYIYGDYVDGHIRRLVLDEDNVVVADLPFATAAPGPVEIIYHDNAIWFTSVTTGTLRKITYAAGANRSPVAVASADRNAGLLPLTVNFSSAGSFDPDDNQLTYFWEFGDGATSNQANPQHTYTGSPRIVNARLTVTDNGTPNLQHTSPQIRISLGNQAPVATITSPANNSFYNAGQTITYSGTGVDPEDGTRPGSAFTWRVVFHHDDHTHPFLGPLTGATGGSFVIPDLGETATDVWYEITLTVTDSQGVPTSTTTRINPNLASVTLRTLPGGLMVSLDGSSVTTPHTFQSVVGFKRSLDVPLPQSANGTTYSSFGGWSDGGARAHQIAVPAGSSTYTAVLVADSAPSRTPLAGDWNGDATGSVGLYFRANGTFALKNANTPGAADHFFFYGSASPGLVAVSGDWDGNGTRTPGLYDPATSAFFLRNSNAPGPADTTVFFGAAGNGWTPVTGDWNGDGTDTIGLYDPSTGAFFLRNSNAPGAADVVAFFGTGGASVVPVAGDWDGNGSTTIGIYNTSTSTFFLKNANASGAADLAFTFGVGNAGLVPVAANWDGVAGESIGLYDRANGVFFLKNVNAPGAADHAFSYGPTGP